MGSRTKGRHGGSGRGRKGITLQRERDDAAILEARGIAPRVGFLYDRPPGLPKEKKQEGDDTTKSMTAATATAASKPMSDRTTILQLLHFVCC